MKRKPLLAVVLLVLAVSVVLANVDTSSVLGQGTCTLKVIAGNELAKTGTVYLDGEKVGTLEAGELIITDIPVGEHLVVLDGGLIQRQEKNVRFGFDYEYAQIVFESVIAGRTLDISTHPSGARVWINERELDSRSPVQAEVEVGEIHEIYVLLEKHGDETRFINIPVKGDPITLNIAIPSSPPPEKPVLIYPEHEAQDIQWGNITLKWESHDTAVAYRVEFDGKTNTTRNNHYTVRADERGKTYSWRVTAIDRIEKETKSETCTFTTRENKPPIAPHDPSPSDRAPMIPLKTTLSWECFDPDGDSITYDIYFGTSQNPPLVASGIRCNSFEPENIEALETYYWRVVAKDSFGAQTESPLWVFETDFERLLFILEDESTWVYSIAVSPDGRYVVGAYGKDIYVWDLVTREVSFVLSNLLYSARTLAISPDGEYLVSGGHNHIGIWNLHTRSNIIMYKIDIFPRTIHSIEIHPEGEVFVTGSSDSWVSVRNLLSRRTIRTMRDHITPVLSVAISPDGKYIVSASEKATYSDDYHCMKIWDFETGEEVRTLRGHQSSINSVCISPSGTHIVSGSGDGTIKIWDFDTGTEIRTLRGHAGSVTSVTISPNGRYIVSGSGDGTIRIWDFDTGREMRTLEGHDRAVQVVAISADSRYIISCSHDSTIRVWSFKEIRTGLWEPPEVVLVEGGTFIMGDEYGDLSDETRPAHSVTITYDFYMGKYPITFDEFDRFCIETARREPSDEGWGRGDRPAINIPWRTAIEYCNWLSDKEGLPKAYDDMGNLLDENGEITTDLSKVVGYRLPTEAEWEFAARGANRSEGYKYAGSDDVNDVAWYRDNSEGMTHQVGSKAPNELGIYDMSGNVWEWCNDRYVSYTIEARTDPSNACSGSRIIRRGGSWGSHVTSVRVSARYSSYPATYSFNQVGFRVVRTVHSDELADLTEPSLSSGVIKLDYKMVTDAPIAEQIDLANRIVNILKRRFNEAGLDGVNIEPITTEIESDKNLPGVLIRVWVPEGIEKNHVEPLVLKEGKLYFGDVLEIQTSPTEPTAADITPLELSRRRLKDAEPYWLKHIHFEQTNRWYYVSPKINVANRFLELDGSKVIQAKAQINPRPSPEHWQYMVSLWFSSEGARIFRDITESKVAYPMNDNRKLLAIILDDKVIIAPVVQSAIRDGYNIIDLSSLEEAEKVATLIVSGVIPVGLVLFHEEQISESAVSYSEKNIPPVVTKISGLEGEITTTANTFKWTRYLGGEIAGYEYRKNSGNWVDHGMNTSYTWTGYSEGPHSFEVRAGYNKGVYSEATLWSFVYVPEPLLSAPRILSPGTDSAAGEVIDTLTPKLTWEEVEGAESYTLDISVESHDYPNVIYNADILYGDNHKVPIGELEWGKKYRWNMQARSAEGKLSDISNTLYFQIDPTLPQSKLSVSTSPSDSQILVDHWFVGRSPVTIDIAPGDYTLSARKEGYHTEILSFSATEGRHQSFSIALEELPDNFEITFSCLGFEQVVREVIGKPSGPIYKNDVSAIGGFSANDEGITDISGIEHFDSLESLRFQSNSVTDISPLAGLTKLQQLDFSMSSVSDISPLAELKNLEVLYFVNNSVTDISPLAGLTNLRWLMFWSNSVSDISPLAELTSLESLRFQSNSVTDISPLAELKNLEVLNFDNNAITDISPLAGLANLEWLGFSHNSVSDISPLAGLTNLEVLYFVYNTVTDISPLAGFTSLRVLYFYHNLVSDISPLAGLTNLRWLYFSDNSVSDISALADNAGISSGDSVNMRNNYLDLSPGSQNMNDIQALIDRGVKVFYEPQRACEPPTVTKISGPEESTPNYSSTFVWIGEGDIDRYEYRKDGKDWIDHGMNTSYTWTGYERGEHVFELRVGDNEGKYSESISWEFAFLPRDIADVFIIDTLTYSIPAVFSDVRSPLMAKE